MQMSEQIIEILDYLCGKFGIVVDWTNGNVFPYLQTLCEKLISYEIATSIIWIVISAIVILLSIIFSIKLNKGDNSDEVATFFLILFLLSLALVFIVVLGQQIFDIVECSIIPEKYLIEYISKIAENKTF